MEIVNLEERDVGIISVKIYDDLALKAWTQSLRRQRSRERREKDGRMAPPPLPLNQTSPPKKKEHNLDLILLNQEI